MARDKEAGGIVIAILIGLYLLVQAFKVMFPFFAVLTVLCFIVAVVLMIHDGGSTASLVAAGAFIVFLILTIISYGIGYGIEQTEIGKTFVDAGEALYDATEEVKEAEELAEDTLKNATIKVIDDLEEQVSDDVKPTYSTIKKIVEVS